MRNLEILGKRLNRLSNLNIYENSRKREYIEARSVFCVIAYKYYDYTYAQIAGYLRSKGKTSDHATVLHSLRSFDIYSKYSTHLQLWLSDLVGGAEYRRKEATQLISHKIKQLTDKDIIEVATIVDKKFNDEIAKIEKELKKT